ncbi:MAG: Sensor histidine kinase BtsS [Gammaproteobacteria bacterium]|nr:Sensor histidine kinase BtsS [Gammaproteobacteria bacterium]
MDVMSESRSVRAGEGFLPNFCHGPIVLNVIVVAQFLAIAITIIIPPLTQRAFLDLFLVSLFVQWIALTSVCALCIAGQFLNSLPEHRALFMAYLLLLCVTWLVGECALWLLSNFDVIASVRPGWYAYFHVQNLTVSAIVNALVLRYLIARHQLQLTTRSAERARAEVLRQKIRPHFLFNSMNIIASLTRRAPTKAESAIEDMADLFRVMLNDDNDLSPIHNEISIAKKYLKLERLRLDKRLKVNWKARELPRSARIPVLILQLLLEHVVHNAVEQMSDTGVIQITVECKEHRDLVIELTAPYPDPASGEAIDAAGLENIRLRLSDHYGTRSGMRVSTGNGRIFVRITHPAFKEDDKDARISS